MAGILRQVGQSSNIAVHHYEADQELDMNSIPVISDGKLIVPMGSTCYVIGTGKTYKLNSGGSWKEYSTGGGGYDPSNHYIWNGGDHANGTWD